MNSGFLAILLFLLLLIVPYFYYMRGWDVERASLIVFGLAGAMALFVWKAGAAVVSASVIQGLVFGGKVAFLLFMAIFFTQTLAQSGALTAIRRSLEGLHPDRRVQGILIAWFLGSGVESLIGFSQTGAACSFILASMGFPPACAIMLAVMGPVASSTFCSMGSPIVMSMADRLQSDPQVMALLTHSGIDLNDYLQLITNQAAVIHAVIGTLIPVWMVVMMTRFFGKNKSWTEGLSMAPFALFCGAAFTIPYALTAIFIGPELPGLVGSIIGMSLSITAVKTNFLLPHDRWNFQPKKDWEKDWQGDPFEPDNSPMPSWKGWLAYALLAGVLILSRWPLGAWLRSFAWDWQGVFGTFIHVRLEPFYLTGFIVFLMVWVVAWIYKTPGGVLRNASGDWAVSISWINALENIPYVIIACVFVNTAVNASGLPGMVETMARGIASLPGSRQWGAFLSPFFGMWGSFGAQNTMFSHLIFGSLQFHLAQNLLLPTSLFMALQAVGGSATHMISEHYLAGTCSIVGMLGWETPVARRTIYPMLFYIISAGMIGLVLVQFPHLLNWILSL